MTRRGLVAGAGGVGALSTTTAARADEAALAKVTGIFAAYDAFGGKASGGPGDLASGAWLEGAVRGWGYETERHLIETPYFEPVRSRLEVGEIHADVLPQAIVVPTTESGLTAPLTIWDAHGRDAARGAIVLVVLPYARWSTAKSPAVAKPVAAALKAGAAAVVIVTTGPTGEALALNASVVEPIGDRPIVILAPKEAAAFLDAAQWGKSARLTVIGKGGRRPSFNLVARKSNGARETLVVSTPRSGWFGCMGERGPGVAAWLLLAEHLAKRPPKAGVLLLATSGHEYENAGGLTFLKERAPPPDRTALWLHLGANVAARDWHDLGALTPLPSADPQRYLVATDSLLPRAKAAFAGLPGLEAAYPASGGAAGEAAEILAAGYPNVAAIFGAHRYHHALADDLRCVDPRLVLPVVRAAEALIASVGV